MSALKVLSEIEQNMTILAPYRSSALFNEFLVKGYTAMTLSSVPRSEFEGLLQAKLCLGTLITLYDDFADRPTESDPQLLEVLYQFSFGRRPSAQGLNARDRHVLDFAGSLFARMERLLTPLPHYRQLAGVLNFDLARFYSANQFSSVLTANPFFNNPLENRLYSHHNMGMVVVAMMDLMAVEDIKTSEFGAMREVFLMGQRAGRIFNVLTTRRREAMDGDITGELSSCMSEQELEIAERRLRRETGRLRHRIEGFASRITTFSVNGYLEGLAFVERLHKSMEGTI